MWICQTCSSWRAWIHRKRTAKGQVPLRPLNLDEVAEVIEELKALRLPWSNATNTYITETLTKHPTVPVDRTDWMKPLMAHMTRLYNRAVLPPKTNIGTLPL